MKKPKRRGDHRVLLEKRSKRVTGELNLGCRGCGDELTLLLPCSLTIVPRVMSLWSREHTECRQVWDEARAQPLRVLDERLGQVEAMELERDWAEAKARGEV